MTTDLPAEPTTGAPTSLPAPPTPRIAASTVFVNLPVRDLDAAKRFYEAIGFAVDPTFTDENASAIVFGRSIYAMLLRPEYFRTFTSRPQTDATQAIEVITALGLGSRADVDAVADAALAAGGTESRPTQDMGWMYSRGFCDLDGHHWEVLSMDEAAAAQAFAQDAGHASSGA
ncbi:VOC family protein [Puerhibacterium sp. TATVAM-FAB25]|uniref:VOC family protein n=1 Tax=Puerhibacterium sp. TATVAM-FAB25 TaxID=3093699 RepID=UPI00397A5096